jgi:hypothetical protein
VPFCADLEQRPQLAPMKAPTSFHCGGQAMVQHTRNNLSKLESHCCFFPR